MEEERTALTRIAIAGVLALAWALAPAGASAWATVRPGIEYQHIRRSSPSQHIHVTRVDLRSPHVGLRVTREQHRGRVTSSFAQLYGAQVAINGGFFRAEEGYGAEGIAMSDGRAWSSVGFRTKRRWLAIGADNRIDYGFDGEPIEIDDLPSWFRQAINGRPALVRGGRNVAPADCPEWLDLCDGRHPRTATGISENGRWLYLVVVDGRRSDAAGMTAPELARLMIELGAYEAVNHDGGGSSTMWVRGRGVVNRPSDGSERRVAMHLGITWHDPFCRGNVRGAVRRVDGTGVRDARVVIANGRRRWSATTAADGSYQIRGVQCGIASLAASKDGFEPRTRELHVVPIAWTHGPMRLRRDAMEADDSTIAMLVEGDEAAEASEADFVETEPAPDPYEEASDGVAAAGDVEASGDGGAPPIGATTEAEPVARGGCSVSHGAAGGGLSMLGVVLVLALALGARRPRSSARASRAGAAAIAAVLAACTGSIGPGGDAHGGGPAGGGGSGPTAPAIDEGGGACALEAAPFRRLTRDEYLATVRDLLGVEPDVANDLPPDGEIAGFDTGGHVSPLAFELYMRSAEDLAARVDLAALAPCDAATAGESACGEALVDALGRRAFRRPVPGDVRARLVALFEATRAEAGLEHARRVVVRAMLTSPFFLYRVELGENDAAEGEVLPLSSWERASRLSYLLWGTMPDDALFEAAASGELATRASVEAQARRMLEDPRAKDALRRFLVEWLEIDVAEVSRDAVLFPEFDAATWTSMRRETEAFLDHVVWDGEGTLDALFTSPVAFVDARAASVYGVAGVTGDAPVRVELDGAERAGILTRAALLAALSNPNETSPIRRGVFVRERILCDELPSPPADLMIEVPEPDPTATTRQRYEQHRSDPVCASCHSMIDPIGFGFEGFDALGRARTIENGLPIDESGELTYTTDADGTFTGVVELSHRLAGSEDVRRCVTKQLFRRFFGRHEESDADCALDGVYEAFEASGWDLREMLVAFTKSDAFLYRRVARGEGTP